MKNLIVKNYKVITFFTVIILIFTSIYYYFFNVYQPENMLGKDIRLFRNTPIWNLAKAVDNEDTNKIYIFVKDKGIPIDFQEPKFGQTLLIWATYCGRERAVEALLKLGADPNLQDHYNGDNAILIASDASLYSNDWCSPNLLRIILKYGGDPNTKSFLKFNDKGGVYGAESPLTKASRVCLEKVKLLVDAGANINYVSKEGFQNPLVSSLSMKKPDIVKYLLIEKGANYRNAENLVTIYGDTITVSSYLRTWDFPLDSEEYKIKMEIVQYLKEQGEDYWSCPIPKKIRENYPQEYLTKY